MPGDATVWVAAMTISAAAAMGAAATASAPVSVRPSPALQPPGHRPEPVCYAVMRRLLTASSGAERLRLRQQLRQWRAMAHDGAVKVGDKWVPAGELQRRRELFADHLKNAEDLLRKADRRRPRTPADQSRQRKLRAQGHAYLVKAARVWGDPLIGAFLQGQIALLNGNADRAEKMFDKCIGLMPLVAGFHQGRAMARHEQGRRLEALTDRVVAFNLRSDDAEAYRAVEEAMKNVPGRRITSEAFTRAKELLAEYEAPTRGPSRERSGRGVRWMMPGRPWQGAKRGLPTPAYDQLILRKTVAVPATENGVLLCDARALEGAVELLLELPEARYVRARRLRKRRPSPAAKEVSLALVLVTGCTFEPVAMAETETPSVRVGDELTLHAHSLPGEMDGPAPRSRTVRVSSVGQAGQLTLDGQLLPGESGGFAFNADGGLVTYLAGRTDVHAENGGSNVVAPPAAVAKVFAAAVKAGGSRAASNKRGAVVREGDNLAEHRPVLTLHILVGKGGPKKTRSRR